MHTYDFDRHVWRYDIGGFAWDNSELSPDLWFWTSVLRTGNAAAFRFAEAVVISSMRYLQIPMAAFVAYLLFDEVMAPVELIGAAVVIISCVFIAWREFVRARDRQTINSTDTA